MTSTTAARSRRAPRPYRQADVFGTGPMTGNPVAVVLDADGLEEDTMRRFSAWTNLSETAFVLAPTSSAADYRVRIFSLNTEIPFALHPTLGTACAWLDAGGVPATPALVMQECSAGIIPVRVDGHDLAFTAPPRTRTGPVEPKLLAQLNEILGVTAADVIDAEWLDNGPGWIGVLLADAATVTRLRPKVAAHSGRWDIGVIGLHPPGADAAVEVRAFFTDGDQPLREDPVTGSLNAAAAEWLTSTGRLSAPYIATQGRAVGREGRVHISADDNRIWVGGRVEITITGVVTI